MTTQSHIEGNLSGEWESPANDDLLIGRPARSASWARIAVTWHTALDHFVPIGYEDESGFHYGEMPVANAAQTRGNTTV
jgi:hypothetical protein